MRFSAVMNILIVSQYAVPPSEVGITRHFALARSLVDRGHQVTILASSFQHWTREETLPRDGGEVGSEVRDGIRFVRVRTPAYQTNSLARITNMVTFARRVLRADVVAALPRPDLVLGSSPPLFATLAAQRLARRFGVPFVMEVRDLWPASLVHLGGYSRFHPVVLGLGILERFLYRRAAAIVSVLPDAESTIVRHGGPAGRVAWIPNGVDLQLLPPYQAARDHEGPWVVMYAGAHNLANALDTVLEAARILESDLNGPRFRFQCLGEGPEKDRLRRQAAEMGLQSIAFEDAVPKSEVYRRLQQADMFVLALQPLALYDHGISINKLFDYLSLGRPIIFATGSSNNPVAEADAGVSIPAGDAAGMAQALRQVAALPVAERRRLGENGRSFIAANHDTRRLAERLEAVLETARTGHSVA